MVDNSSSMIGSGMVDSGGMVDLQHNSQKYDKHQQLEEQHEAD